MPLEDKRDNGLGERCSVQKPYSSACGSTTPYRPLPQDNQTVGDGTPVAPLNRSPSHVTGDSGIGYSTLRHLLQSKIHGECLSYIAGEDGLLLVTYGA